MDNSPCVSAARIWSKNTWLSEKHINKYIQSIARAFFSFLFFFFVVWELPLQRWVFLSVVNFFSFLMNKKKKRKEKEKEKKRKEKRKTHKCRRKRPQSWAPAKQPGISFFLSFFLSFFFLRRQTDGYSQVASNLLARAELHRPRLPHPFREPRRGNIWGAVMTTTPPVKNRDGLER